MSEAHRLREEYTPALCKENLAFARGVLACLSGVEPLPALEGGLCELSRGRGAMRIKRNAA